MPTQFVSDRIHFLCFIYVLYVDRNPIRATMTKVGKSKRSGYI